MSRWFLIKRVGDCWNVGPAWRIGLHLHNEVFTRAAANKLEAAERTIAVVLSYKVGLLEFSFRLIDTPMYHITLFILVILLSFLLQSFTVVLFIRTAIVNLAWLICLLLQDLGTATRYLCTNITANTAAHNLGNRVLQEVVTAIQSICGMAARLCRAILLGASTAVWSIWALQDRVRDRIFPAPSRVEATSSAPSDSFSRVQCSDFTDSGRCGREKAVVGGGSWYCFQHRRQNGWAHV